MESLRKGISDCLSLIIAKDNNEYYTWGEITIGFVALTFLGFAIFLLQ